MPSFSVNGIAASTTNGAASVGASNSFTLSWSGLDSATNYTVYFNIETSPYAELTNSAGSDSFLYYFSTPEYASSWMTYKAIGTSGSDTITSSTSLAGKTLTINYRTTFESATYYITFTNPNPTITAQPSITSISPTSGKSTTIKWSAAIVSNQGSATIYYQYFVGPSSTYSDSYHVGTTTSLSATITETNILAKCGSGFKGTCYLFVRAYWDNGSTQGGWSTPVGKTFTYDPVTLTAPGNPAVSQSGSSYKVSWTAAKGAGGSGNITYVVVVGDEGEIYQAGTATSIDIAIPSSWYGKSIKFRVWAYYSGKEEACVSYTYFTATDPVSLTKPGNPTITQSANKLTAKWSAATGKGGSGTVSYQLYRGNGTKVGSSTTATSLTFDVPSYDSAVSYYVIASYSGKTAQSGSTSFTAKSPTVTAPTNVKVEQSGTDPTKLIISWNAATGSNGSGSVTYVVGEGTASTGWFESYYQANTSTSITINCPVYDTEISYTVEASYSNGSTTVTNTSSHVAITPKGPSVTAPPSLKVTQSGTQITVSWGASTGTYGSGNVTYTLYVGTASNYYAASYSMNTARTKTFTPPAYDAVRYYTVRASYGNGVKTVTNDSRVSFTALSPTVTAPGKPNIVQNGNQYTASWTASVGSYGSGSITYKLYLLTDGIFLTDALSATSVTLGVPIYGYTLEYRVVAYYGGKEAWSETSAITFVDPISLTAPGNPTIRQSGSNYVVSWEAAKGTGGSGAVTYVVVVGDEGEAYQAGTATSITIAIPDAWYAQSIRFRVWAYYSDKESVCADYTYFTANKAYITAPTNLRVNKLTAYTGSTAPLTWTASSLMYTTGVITYHIMVDGSEIASTTSTSYTISEATTKNYKSVSIAIYATGSG